MAVTAADIKIYLSGAGSDGGAQADPALSLGGYRGSTLKNTATTLNGAINDSATTIVVTNASTGGLATGSYFTIDGEIILGGTLSTQTFTGCTRGQHGTSAAAHATLAPVIKLVTNAFIPRVTGDQQAAGLTNYRFFVLQNSAASTASSVVIYLADVTGDADDVISFAVEVPTGNASTGYFQGPVATEETAPTVNAGNVSNWSTATNKATGVAININGHSADLAQNNILGVWIKQVVGAGAAAVDANNYAIGVAFDSPA